MIYEYRWDFIKKYVQDKNVLEIGPAELVGTVNKDKYERWIHRRISEKAKSLIGLEKNYEQVKALNDLGFNIIEGNAENFHFKEKFDVIIAGELIEHLSNPGLFLDCAKENLKENGKLVLTTPNRYGILSIIGVLKNNEVPKYEKNIAKHVLYFDEDALNSLLIRHGFREIEFGYCKWVGKEINDWKIKFAIKFTEKIRHTMLPVLLTVATL